MMLKIGITGGIGSGKSLVCRIFSLLGIPVYNADESARRLMESDEEVRLKLSEAFGNIYNSDGSLNRQKLASEVFHDEEKLKTVNSIVHPAVKNDYARWEQMQHAPYIIRESAILFESGTDAGLDYIITVNAPEEKRIERVMKRDKRQKADIKAIIANQLSDDAKTKKSDFTIINDDHAAVLPQVWKLHEQFSHGEQGTFTP